jgi:predicted MFS family arabinose efflux permease
VPQVTTGIAKPYAEAFRSFRHRNYRLWFAGQLGGVFGYWTQATALGFLAYELTHSAALLGYLTLAQGLPSWLLMLYGGAVADRFERRGILVVTQVCITAVSVALAVLTFAKAIGPVQILALGTVTGIITAFDAPARQAFVLELVERDDLTNAVALNSTMYNLGTAAGPAFGGLLYAAVGPAWCYAAAAVMPVLNAACLLAMRMSRPSVAARSGRGLADVVVGIRRSLGDRDIRGVMILMAAITLFGFSAFTLFPAWAVAVLGGGAETNGLLHSARGAGAVVSALWIAAMGARIRVRGLPLVLSVLGLPVAMVLFVVGRSPVAAMVALFAVGGLMIAAYSLANSLVQTLVEDELRGRVMALYSLTFFGFVPLGGVIVGELAERLGLAAAVWFDTGALAVTAAVVWLHMPWLRKLA